MKNSPLLIHIIAFIICILTILIASLLMGTSIASEVFFGKKIGLPSDQLFRFPFSIQNLLHVLLFAGLAEIYIHFTNSRHESSLLKEQLLPEYDEALRAEDLGIYRQKIIQYKSSHRVLPTLIDRSILQFKTQQSVDQVVSVLNTTLDLKAARLDASYHTLNYLVWVIPTFGFVGTIIGISAALRQLSGINTDFDIIEKVTSSLSTAFYTTLVALIWSAVLYLLIQLVKKMEQNGLINMGDYVLENLVNRLVER